MNARNCTIAFLLSAATGCALGPIHEVRISTALRENPVRSVFVFAPEFSGKVKRLFPDDLAEMAPANKEESAARLLSMLKETIGASITVDSSYSPDDKAKEWVRDVAAGLMKQRIPLQVKSMELPMESALIVAVIAYGKENAAISVKPIWSKRFTVGKPKWSYTCNLVALLVNPKNGAVLFDVHHEATVSVPAEDPKLLDKVAREAASAIASAFPPPLK